LTDLLDRQCDLPEGNDAFMAADLAYQTLTDPEKKKQYDYLLTLHNGRFRGGDLGRPPLPLR